MAKYLQKIRYPVLLLQTMGLTSLIDVLRGLIVYTQAHNGWYKALNKPYIDLPLWSFAPVGIVIYLCLGVALYMVVKQPSKESKKYAYMSFGLQCGLGTLWPFTFFILHGPWVSFTVALALIASIIWTMHEFNSFHESAVYWLAPHLIWAGAVCFLNLSVALLN